MMPVKREFLDWNQHALPAAASYLINRYAKNSDLDLSNVVLVFPGRRAARRMLELLVQTAADRWPNLIPPTMVTFDRFPEMLYPQQLRLADDLTQLLVWKHALSSVPTVELKAALPTIPDDESVPAWLALCETLRRQHNELAADGMEFDQVQDELIKSGNPVEAERWKALRRIQAEYLVQMDSLQLWDKQAARLVAVDQNECRSERDIILIGTVDMNRSVRRMIDQVADRVTVLIHAPEDEHECFDEHGCLVADVWQHRLLNIPATMMKIVDSPSDQASIAVGQLASLNGQYRVDEIAIGIANDDLVPSMMQGLSNAGLTGRWPIGLKVAKSRPYRLLDAIARHLASARDGVPADFATLSDLVRHADVSSWIEQQSATSAKKKWGARSDSKAKIETTTLPKDWLTELDTYLADHLQLTPGVMLGREPRRIIVAELCDSVERLLAELLPVSLRGEARIISKDELITTKSKRRLAGTTRSGQRQLTLDDQQEHASQSVQSLLTRRRSLLEWAEGTVRLIAAIYRDNVLDEQNLADRAVGECVDALQTVVETLRQVPGAVMPKTNCVQALQLILRQISDGNVPPEANDDAIDLMGWLELPLDDSPVVILAGFNEGYVPESINSDVFLPNSFRQQLGLTDNLRRYARDAYALTTLMHNRRKFCLIAGKVDHKGNPVAPSRLWFAAEAATLPARVRMFYGIESAIPSAQSGGPEIASSAVSDLVETVNCNSSDSAESSGQMPFKNTTVSRRSGFIIPTPPKGLAAPAEISVTAFRDYMQCPYRYFIRRELRLKSIEDETRELSAASFGSLVHEVLNRFGQSQYRDAASADDIELFLLNELQKLAVTRFGVDRSATVAVQLKMLESRFQKFAEWQAAAVQEGWRIVHTEADLRYDQFKDIRDRPVALIGRIDRIDQNIHSREWRVLDYKTSESADKPEATHRKNDEWIDLQLPLYQRLVETMGIRGEMQLGYVNLPGDLSKIGCNIASWQQGDLISAYTKAREVAADILDLKIDRVMVADEQWQTEFSRLCQDRVIDRNIPWLASWSGRGEPL